MAEENKIVEERIYTVPLRKEWIKTSRVKRAKRAVNVLRSFISRHMHSEDIRISPEVNDVIWSRGAKKPPAKIKVKVTKDDKGLVEVMLPETEKPKVEKKVKKEKPEEKPAVNKKSQESRKENGESKAPESKKNNKTASKNKS